MKRTFLALALACTAAGASGLRAQAPVDSLRLYFPWGSSVLTAAAKHTLDLGVYRDFFAGERYLVYGYTDASGSTASNLDLSASRVQALQAYLRDTLRVRVNFEVAVGRGEAQANQAISRNAEDRFVTIYRARPVPPAAKADSTARYRPVRAFNPIFHRGCVNCPPEFEAWTHAVNAEAYALYKQGKDPYQRSGNQIGGRMVVGTRRTSVAGLRQALATARSGPSQGDFAIQLALNYAVLQQPDSVFYFLNWALDACGDTGAACADVWDPNILGFYQFEPYAGAAGWHHFQDRILTRYRSRHPAAAAYLPLILAGGADQSVRFPLGTTDPGRAAAQNQVARRNNAFIRTYIARHGFPKRRADFPDAADAAFLLVQHSEDTALQRMVLAQLRTLLKAGEADSESVALLTDRYGVNTTGRQWFGTQRRGDGLLFPIEEAETVNRRRAAYGLDPLRY